MELAAILFSLFFAMNIGASGAAASMGVAYGSGAIKENLRFDHMCSRCAGRGGHWRGEVVKPSAPALSPSRRLH